MSRPQDLQALYAAATMVGLTEALVLKRRANEQAKQPKVGGSEHLPGRGGQGVHREVESEGHEEKYRAAIEGEIP